MAGADLLVTGTLTDLGGGWVEVNARLVRVEDGRVLRAAKAKARKAWSESAPGPALSTPAPPEPASMKAAVVAPASGDGARKVAGRNIALRYAEPGRRPSVRVTDYTDPARPQWTEVPIRYLPRENRYEEFSADFSLAGRRYRLWTDLSSNLHLAPRSLLGGVWEKDRVVFPMQEVFEAWVSDIEKRSQLLEETPKSRIIAYYEPLERTDLRVSLFRVERSSGVEHLDYEPIEVEVLPGRGRRGGPPHPPARPGGPPGGGERHRRQEGREPHLEQLPRPHHASQGPGGGQGGDRPLRGRHRGGAQHHRHHGHPPAPRGAPGPI